MKEIVEQYHGKYYIAEPASKYIDLKSIINKCQNLSSVGEGFNTISSKICSTGENCDATALSIDGKSLDKHIIEQGKSINRNSSSITEIADEIVNKAIDVYNDMQRKLNEKAQEQESNYLEKINRKK